MEIKRRPFQGVLNILSFNRHFYFIGFAFLALIFLSRLFFTWPETLFWIVVGAFAYGLIMPLIVSAYVYDFSGYYDMNWINQLAEQKRDASRILNINAGFDETSFLLKNKFPGSDLKVYDFYNPMKHTEAAIKRARNVSLVYPDTRTISSDNIPVEDQSADIVFLLSAAHEIRSNKEKIIFLKECRRVCKPGGRVVMVEHLRDLPNFIAFSVGFTHFFSRSTWKNAFHEAGFRSFEEKKFTPFMSVFQCTN